MASRLGYRRALRQIGHRRPWPGHRPSWLIFTRGDDGREPLNLTAGEMDLNVGVYERSFLTTAQSRPGDGYDWQVIGVDIFSRAIDIRVLLSGKDMGAKCPQFGSAIVARTTRDGAPLRKWSMGTASPSDPSTTHLTVDVWFERDPVRSVDFLSVSTGSDSLVLLE